jgi:methionyl-tRNA formyltransferase
MKAVVFAYHDMGITGLEALKRAEFDITAVFSHDDDPKENCWFGSVRDWATENNIPLFCPESVNTADWRRRITAWEPDVFFSFYYRSLLGREMLEIPPKGAFNLHGSLLPLYRGRCPVNWVLVNGEKETGVTLHRMVEMPDAGDIAAQKRVPIAFEDTAVSLYGKLCRQGALLLDEVLPRIKDGTVIFTPQDIGSGSYFGGRNPDDGRIDWRWPAMRIYNLIRAVTEPYPGAFAFLMSGEKIVIWWALPEEDCRKGYPGKIEMENGSAFVCSGNGGSIRLMEIEINGRRLKNVALWSYLRDREGEIMQ